MHTRTLATSLSIFISIPCFLTPCLSIQSQGEEVYQSDFSEEVDREIWSSQKTKEFAPGEHVLGPLGRQESTAFSLRALPKHKLIRLRLDLITFGGWDGDFIDRRGNPNQDSLSISLKHGPLLMTCTFCDWGPDTKGKQSFPDEWLSASHPSQTGRGPGPGARYPIDIIFPHAEDSLTLYFRGNTSDSTDLYGFTNVRVDTLDDYQKLKPEESAKLWADISEGDPMAANRAVWRFVAAGQVGLTELLKHHEMETARLKEAHQAAMNSLEERFRKALKDLENTEFAKRQEAVKAIVELDTIVVPLIETELASDDLPAETRALLDRILQTLRGPAAMGEVAVKQRLIDSRVRRVQRVVDWANKGMTTVSSAPLKTGGWDGPDAVLDGYVPAFSKAGGAPRFTWYPKSTGVGRLRVDISEPRELSEAGVFFLLDNWGVAEPASWRLEYRDPDGIWREVVTKDSYEVKADQFNTIKFEKIRADYVRFVMEFNDKRSVGIHEVFVR